MKLPCLFQFRILKTAIKSLFGRPFTIPFPHKAFEAIPQYRGRPRYHKDDCIGCGACAQVCPSNCIDVIDEPHSSPPMRRLVQHFDACTQCAQCERYCTTEKGIKLDHSFDYVGFKAEDFEERVEKELLLCECCGEVIAPVDQLRWLARRLGALTFTNPTLMLVSQKDLALVDDGVKTEATHAVRGQRISIQCPKCRRQTALAI